MKDFYDIYHFSRIFDFDGAKLQAAVFETLQRRGTPYDKSSFTHIENNTPEFPFAIAEIQAFLEPVFDAMVNEEEWQRQWKSVSIEWIRFTAIAE